MKALSVNVPTDGTIIISRRKKRNGDPAQLDCWGGYDARWVDAMISFIRNMPRPIRMSEVRKLAAINGLPAPLSKNSYGKLMSRAARVLGLRIVGSEKSPIKSRRGGRELVWA
jgi:hypothetical protein